MEHKYFEAPSEKELNEITDFTGNDNEIHEPSKYSVDFILSYSKSLSVQVNKKFGPIFFNLN